jgi:hypothetical protein
VVAGAGALALLLWVTSSGSVTVLGPPQDPFALPHATIQPRTAPLRPTGTPPPQPTIDMSKAHEGPTVFGLLLTILAVLVAVVVAAAVAYYVYRLVRFRRDRPREAAFEALPDVAASVVEDAESQFAALAEGRPRNAIVACWLRLEEAVASAGLPRRPSETSAEFTTRVLAGLSVDPDSVHELAHLYRVARFSTHDLGEDDRDRAVSALRRTHDELQHVGKAHARTADAGPAGPTDPAGRAGSAGTPPGDPAGEDR